MPKFISSTRVYPTFHTSKLRPFHNRTKVFPSLTDTFDRPPPIATNGLGKQLFEIDKILQKRVRHGHFEYQIHFKGYPPTHLQWEPFTANNRHT